MNKQYETILFDPTYVNENGLLALNSKSIPFPKDFEIKDTAVVYLKPSVAGGNHKHPRTEIFVGFGGLVFYYQDENNKLQSELMYDKHGKLKLFIVPPFLAHAVRNESSMPAFLYEFADHEQHDVEKIDLFNHKVNEV